MNILFLEDRGATAYSVERWLTNSGHHVLNAFNPNDAQTHWTKRAETPIHCIILDLQTSMDGLTLEQKAEAEGSTLAGWIWFRDNVLAEAPEMRQRTIIYSDYVAVLREKVPGKQYEGIKVVPKRQRGSAAKVVIETIQKIDKLVSGQAT
jgi:CheY-like chemotaxis protein